MLFSSYGEGPAFMQYPARIETITSDARIVYVVFHLVILGHLDFPLRVMSDLVSFKVLFTFASAVYRLFDSGTVCLFFSKHRRCDVSVVSTHG